MAHQTTERSALKLALMARQARARQGEATLLQSEPIAIIGMSCRFPGGANSPDDYWRLLRDGTDAITEVPGDRWDAAALYDPDPAAPGRTSTRWGGFLDRVDGFDPKFFGIAPREAASMDPQQRLLLEVSFEALDDAGLPHGTLAGSPTGVFVALYANDYGMWQLSDADRIDAYTLLGTAHCIASGRLSFLLDLQGPSLVVDSGCSASLVAVHLACQSLRSGECRTALAGAVGLILAPEMSISLSKWGFMAPDGRCKTFDRRADGFVRGEGCGVVVLKRLADALADGDRVLAVIRGTAVNEDGRSTVLTAPSGPSQEAVIRQALENARLDPADVTYVEAHGTGTALGDPIELEALAGVLGQPADGPPCRVGSVKANIGHLEAAAGMAGLIKTVQALRHRWIPPQPHFEELTPHVSIAGTRLEVSAVGGPWLAEGRRRIAGVSAFGFGGTNAHVIVEEAPELPDVSAADEAAYLLPISARSAEALAASASAFEQVLRSGDAPPMRDVCFTAAVRRTPYEYRATVAGASVTDLADGLAAIAAGQSRWDIAVGRRLIARRLGPVFVFCGQGPQWWGMAQALLEADEAFRARIDAIAVVMDPLSGWSLVEALSVDRSTSRLDQTEVAQPAMFALQVALVAAIRARGVEPAAVVGHSVGEIAAAHVAGVLTLEHAVSLVVQRGRLMQRATGHGRMVAVAATADEAREAVVGLSGRVSIAALNAPHSVVLSGEPDAINSVVADLERRGVGCRVLPVDYAFHSHQMIELVPDFQAALEGMGVPARATLPLVSTVTGRHAEGHDLDADYWVHNLTHPVRFAEAIGTLASAGYETFVEIGPHPVLASSILESIGEKASEATVVATQHRGRPGVPSLLAAVGRLFASGQPVDWRRVYGSGRVVALPAYAWQRDRYWIERVSASAASIRRDGAAAASPAESMAGRRLRSPALTDVVFEREMQVGDPAFVRDHRIHGVVLFPATGYLAMALDAATRVHGDDRSALADVSFEEPLRLDDTRRLVQVVVAGGDDDRAFRIVSLVDRDADRWTMHASGRIVRAAGDVARRT